MIKFAFTPVLSTINPTACTVHSLRDEEAISDTNPHESRVKNQTRNYKNKLRTWHYIAAKGHAVTCSSCDIYQMIGAMRIGTHCQAKVMPVVIRKLFLAASKSLFADLCPEY